VLADGEIIEHGFTGHGLISLDVGAPITSFKNHFCVTRHDDHKAYDLALAYSPPCHFIDNAAGSAVRFPIPAAASKCHCKGRENRNALPTYLR
jgi:hypothetical protein